MQDEAHVRAREKYAALTDEERQRLRDYHREWQQRSRAKEAPEKREARYERERAWCRARWARMTEEERRASRYTAKMPEEERKRWAREAQRRKRAKSPQTVRARWALERAVRFGRVKRGPCEVCGGGPAHGHHEDYGKPLDVRWLCRRHHDDVHAGRLVLGARRE